MSQSAISYLTDNKDKFSKEVLSASLKASGYSPSDIEESINKVYYSSKSSVAAGNSSNFILKNSSKQKDVAIGFIGSVALSIIFNLLGYIVSLVLFFIFRKKYNYFSIGIKYGLLAVIFCLVLIILFFISEFSF